MEQAGPEPGAQGTGPRKPPWGCAAGISGGAGTETHSPLDEQPYVPAADGRKLLDILFDCPYEMHNLTADPFISHMVEELSEEHKEVLYFLSLRLYSTTRLAAVRGQSDRNIRKLRKTIHKKLQRQMYDHLCGKPEHSLTLRERRFLEEYSKIARKQGKDAVIRRENKTKRRKKKNRP